MKRPKDWFQRMERWRHNSFLGSARMMQMQSLAIINADTTTDETRQIAQQINTLSAKLYDTLKVRRCAQNTSTPLQPPSSSQ